MKNLCLTCKALRVVTVRQLYRRVELDVGGEGDLKLSAFLGRNNPGIEHIRSLILNPDPVAFGVPSCRASRSPPPPLPPTPPPLPPQIPGFGPPPIIVMTGGPPPTPPPAPTPVILEERRRFRPVEERKPSWSAAHFTVRLLIDMLPEHLLEKFR